MDDGVPEPPLQGFSSAC